MYEVFAQLLAKHNVTPYKVSKATGISTVTLSDWKNGRSVPKQDKIKKIADYFGVSMEFLMTGKEDAPKEKSELTAKDEMDIAKDLDKIMNKLTLREEGPIYFKGQEMPDETINLLKDEIGLTLKRLKIINKKLYNPNKYKMFLSEATMPPWIEILKLLFTCNQVIAQEKRPANTGLFSWPHLLIIYYRQI